MRSLAYLFMGNSLKDFVLECNVLVMRLDIYCFSWNDESKDCLPEATITVVKAIFLQLFVEQKSN